MSVQQQDTSTVFDPWRDLRDLTARRNALLEIADRYASIAKACRAQAQMLKQYPKTSAETLNTLKEMTAWVDSKASPIFDEVQRLSDIITVRTERLNNE